MLTPEVRRAPELIRDGLCFPTSLAFDDDGVLHVAESGLPFGGARHGGRVLRLDGSGAPITVSDGLAPPVNGLAWHDGAFLVSEGGAGQISRVDRSGRKETLLGGLPGPGNYHTNMVVVGPDGWLYFSQGAMTNMGVIGLDAYDLGWLARLPHAHDVPGYDVVLAGTNVTTPDPIGPGGGSATTGAFAPFGREMVAGERIPGRLPCTASVMRCRPDGSSLELVAWGLRNAYGLGFLPDGRLLATDQGPDDRGSRPIGNAPDMLYEVKADAWYGWPDFIGGQPVTHPRFRPARGAAPGFVLANHADLPAPEVPLLRFPAHACAVKFDVVPKTATACQGHLIMALFGDETPMTVPAGSDAVGRRFVRIDPSDWTVHEDLPGAFKRPIDVRIDSAGRAFLLDFGAFEMSADNGVVARPGTGGIWCLPM